MTSINGIWWEHLASNPSHSGFRDIDALLKEWYFTDYGAH